ncbi:MULTISPECIES: hypothetical protein [Pseudomonas]|uniref:hypothetical protein n=1 Tax=Pseudomonas TaxID=286 RepID=UPI002033AD3D|nr:hypothetical protein [Pseudomonas sp. CG7]
MAVSQDGIYAEATLPGEIDDQRYGVSRYGYLTGMYGPKKQARFVRLIEQRMLSDDTLTLEACNRGSAG